MQFLDRKLKFAVGVGLVLPIVIYALIAITLAYRDDEFAAEVASLNRAKHISEAIDARLYATEAVMLAVSVIPAIQEMQWREAREVISAITKQNPDWKNVVVRDITNNQIVVEILPNGALPSDAKVLARAVNASADKMLLSDMVSNADNSPSMYALMKFRPQLRQEYLLEVQLSPAIVQNELIANAPKQGVSAVVDGRGMFVARTLDWTQRLGKPSTQYVRDAISNGTEGVYRGTTWEGMENYTAFFTSPKSNLSTHVAITASLTDSRKQRWRMAAGLIALVTFALGAAVTILALRFAAARRAAATRVEHAQRLEAVGQLTGGIAHDFNNMLAIVISSLDLAKRRLARGDNDIERFLESAMDGAGRAADLTRRLLAFSRKQPLSPTKVDANDVIKNSVEILHRTLPANISLSMSLAQENLQVVVDRNQLENALINLVVNARDAISDSGQITISSSVCRRNDHSSWVAIAVTDTGQGMSADVVARAFEPFFTTKPMGKGTGLGLSQINGFVVQSGGEISIESSIGAGTTVTILLPQSDSQIATSDSKLAADPTTSLPPGKTDEVILLVEDEDQLRANMAYAFEMAGYTVLQAHSAEDALFLIEANRNISVLVTDIILPTMNGRKLVELAIPLIPTLKVLLITGFDIDDANKENFQILSKPFEMYDLGVAVRAALDAEAKPK